MADDYIITLTYKLDTGNVDSEAAAAGKRAGDAFGNAFKPQFDWVSRVAKVINPDEIAKNVVPGIQNAFKNVNLAAQIEAGLSGVRLEKTNFGRSLEHAVTQATQKGVQATEIIPPKPAAGVTGEGANLTARIQPFLSGLEAFSMMMRGAPFLSVAQMAGQAITGFQAQRAAAAIEPGRIYFPGGRPGETENLAISRRLGAVAGAGAEAGAGAGLVEGAAGGGALALLAKGGPIAAGVAALVGAGAGLIKVRDAIVGLGEDEAKTII